MNDLPVQLQSVPFHGDSILAIRTAKDKIMVSLKRVCESLGVNVDGQRTKLLSPDYDWACTEIISVQVGGQPRDMFMIDAESLPMWLVTIHPSKVKAAFREKLRAYKLEAKAVLAAWFMGNAPSRPDISDAMKETLDRLANVERRCLQLEDENARKEEELKTIEDTCLQLEYANATMEDMCKELAGVAESAKDEADHYWNRSERLMKPLEPGSDGEYFGAREFFDLHDVRGITGKPLSKIALQSAGRDLSRMSRLAKIEIKTKKGKGFYPVQCYRIDVLQTWMSISNLGIIVPADLCENIAGGRTFLT